ncbi:hypothetical protein AURDEDRAFT_113028 [Auricularia subglabra TFB-10046 SS5]|nr:hypothetical protein AURDEDRAFT_113028 [Auricularia subglabra TFB-10046 SS5]
MNNHVSEHDIAASAGVPSEQYHRSRSTSYKDKYDYIRAKYDNAIHRNQEYRQDFEIAHSKQARLQEEIDLLLDSMMDRRPPPPFAQAQPPPAPPPPAFYPPAPAPGASASYQPGPHANGGSNGADDTNGHSSKRQRLA